MVFQKPRQMGREMSRERRWLKHPLLVLRHRCQGKQPRSLPDRSKQEESGQEGVHCSAAAPLTGMPQLVQHQGLSGCNSTACPLQCCSLPATFLGGQSPSYLLGQSFIPLYPKRCHPWLCTPCSGPQSWLLHWISYEKPLPTLCEPPFLAFFPPSPFVVFLPCLKCLFPRKLMPLSSLYHHIIGHVQTYSS